MVNPTVVTIYNGRTTRQRILSRDHAYRYVAGLLFLDTIEVGSVYDHIDYIRNTILPGNIPTPYGITLATLTIGVKPL